MTQHATGKSTENGKMQHPVDGKAWKNFDTQISGFAAEPRNVRLGLAANGFNPFGNLMWIHVEVTSFSNSEGFGFAHCNTCAYFEEAPVLP
ncbi:retrotransposon protein, putative, ty3-gypsy subclass [Tanacetum coccineum]|uniref:Retrotransposon protein, putative, ty3-gypsy subclass n=1 Tax=Tanacetum coccineum TaxID=301880 RepID=A0ABQ5CFM3_9ASTR